MIEKRRSTKLPIDGLVVKCLITEFKRRLTGARINKISQPDRYDLYFDLRSGSENCRLLLSANPSLPRAYITSEKKENPITAPGFLMVLRKHFRNGIISSIKGVDHERMIIFDIKSRSELGDESVKSLIIEIMGKHSNIIIIDEHNRIIDAMRHVDSKTSRLREVMPARQYELPPPQDKLSVDDISPETFFAGYKESQQSVKNHIISRIKGFSARSVLEITNNDKELAEQKISQLGPAQISSFMLMLSRLKTMQASNLFSPCLIYSDDEKTRLEDFYCLSISDDTRRKHNKSMSFILDSYYLEKSTREYIRNKSSDLQKAVSKAFARLTRKKKLYLDLIDEAADAPKYKLFGELIISNMYMIKDKRVKDPLVVTNYYSQTNDLVNIPIDVCVSYHKNAEGYFKKAMKLEKGALYSKKALKELDQELDYLNTINYHIENSIDSSDVEQIRKELEDQGYIKRDTGKKQAKKAEKPLMPYHYVSSEGFDIFVGRNNLQNEYLTMKAASSKDMWLHVKDYPGSHVIIRHDSREFTQKSVYEAAITAVRHSRADASVNIDVDYTLVKNVKRHSNKKPGMVYYTDYKTINVIPDDETIKSPVRKV